MSRKKIRGKTVRKLYRLARELETLYGIRVEWGSGFYRGKRYFYFEPIPKNSRHRGCYCTTGFAWSVRQALFNFYQDLINILYCKQRGEYILVKADYQPARYPFDIQLVVAKGLHPRFFFRLPYSGDICEYKGTEAFKR